MPGGAWAGKHHPITEAEQEHCLMQDGNEAGEVWCIKSDVGMSKAQIDAYFLEEGKKVAAEVAAGAKKADAENERARNDAIMAQCNKMADTPLIRWPIVEPLRGLTVGIDDCINASAAIAKETK